MTPEDYRVLHENEQVEKRVTDMIRMDPEAAQAVADLFLLKLGTALQNTPSPEQEFMYLIAWIGCRRISELDDARDEIDDLLFEGDSDENEQFQPA